MLGGSRTDDGHRLMLVDCIAVGDTDEAAKVMRAHIDTSLGATAGWRLALRRWENNNPDQYRPADGADSWLPRRAGSGWPL